MRRAYLKRSNEDGPAVDGVNSNARASLFHEIERQERHQVEQHNPELINRHATIMNGIEALSREIKPAAVQIE